jgi:hypothetical protein
MPKRKEVPKEDQTFTCSNAACSFVFSKPIKVINLRDEGTQPYDACPRCFTEIIVETELPVSEKPELEVEEEKPQTRIEPHGKKVEEEPVAKCAHHFGYLSERPKNEQIPDECVTCEHIVKCMLKGIKN